MSGNPLIKLFVPLLVLALGAVIFIASQEPAQTPAHADGELALSEEEARALGIEGDTQADTLRTLIGEMKRTRAEVEVLREQNQKLVADNQRLLQRDQAIDARIAREVDSAKEQFGQQSSQVSAQAQSLLAELQNKIDHLTRAGDALDIPVGLGLSPADGAGFRDAPVQDAVLWIKPLDGVAQDPHSGNTGSATGFVFPNRFAETQPATGTPTPALAAGQNTQDKPRREENTRAVYTIPENSTLTGALAMTALLGRVPIDGTVNDPYPFKVLIGKDNLTANGIELPDVQGAVMSGTASGDWTLSCVRGQIESITLVFEDGTIRTLPAPEGTVSRSGGQRGGSGDGRIRGGIGYLSDPYGVPCIVGEKKSNAAEYLGNQSLMTAMGAAVASAFSQDDKGRSGSGNSTIVSDRNQAFNTILSQGAADISAWMGKLYGQAFAAVYVPPQQAVTVHIEQELAIDFEPHGRKVVHEDFRGYPAYSTQAALD